MPEHGSGSVIKFHLLILLLSMSFSLQAQQATHLLFQSPDISLVGTYTEERKLEFLHQEMNFTKERQLLQDKILDQLSNPTPTPTTKPRIIFTAGGMGAGKTTSMAALEKSGYLKSSDFIIIDPDKIKELIPEFEAYKKINPKMAATLVHRESTYLADLLLNKSLAGGKNIIFEGSLQNTAYFEKLLEEIKKTHINYEIEIVHVQADFETARARANARYLIDGRYVPDELIQQSLVQSKNSVTALGMKVDKVIVIENNQVPTLVSVQRGVAKTTFSSPLSYQSKTLPLPSAALETSAFSKNDKFKHVVFDLDWTLINAAPERAAASHRLLKLANGEKYYISKDAEKILTDLMNDPRVKVSFFSGGHASRNIEVLKKLKLTDGSGRSFFDGAYKILSKPHLTPMENASESAFHLLNKKKVSLISGNPDLVILIDDQKNFSLEKNKTLHLGNTYTIFESYAEAEKARLRDPTNKYIPPSRTAWLMDRNKIHAAYGVILEALEKSEKEHGSFSKIAFALNQKPKAGFVVKALQHIDQKQEAQMILQESALRQNSIKRIQSLFDLPGCR